jgi:hypothetical protein
MQTYQGYVENGRVIPIGMPHAPDGFRVVIVAPESSLAPGEENIPADPAPGTLEYLFRDYDGASFQAELADLGDPAGNERW